ncbi:hypothetical protein [Streptomyces sp. CA-179760]|uniref:hypothetical protein n=1 Tax=Streptomyces sp. CA-179760 TaxID=3240054 RepID=UPI003D90DB07
MFPSAHAAPAKNSVSLAWTAAACQIGDGHTDFKGTNINMRNSPGGTIIGRTGRGDYAYIYQTDSGPRVTCPDGSSTLAWHLAVNKRTRVVGYVSACFV